MERPGFEGIVGLWIEMKSLYFCVKTLEQNFGLVSNFYGIFIILGIWGQFVHGARLNSSKISKIRMSIDSTHK